MTRIIKLYKNIDKINLLLLIIAALITVIVQSAIINNFFFGDDWINFYNMEISPKNFLFAPFGGQIYFFRSIVIYLLHLMFNYNPKPYFILVIANHALNLILLYYIINTLTKKKNLSFIMALLWGINPLNQGALGWICAYGYVLCTTFVLLVFIDIAGIFKNKNDTIRTLTQIKWFVLLVMSACTNGVGIPIAMLFFIIIYAMLYESKKRLEVTLRFSSLIIIIPIIYYLFFYLTNTPNGQFSPFVFYNLPAIIISTFNFTAFDSSSLFFWPLITLSDAYTINKIIPLIISSENMQLFLNLALIIYISLSLFVFRNSLNRDKLFILSIFILCVGCIAFINLGRAPWWLFFGLKLKYYIQNIQNHRHHYITLILMTLVFSLIINQVISYILHDMYRKILTITSIVFLLILSISSYISVKQINSLWYEKLSKEDTKTIANLQSTMASTKPGEILYLENSDLNINYFYKKEKSVPGIAGLYILYYNQLYDGRIFFVEKKDMLVKILDNDKSDRIRKVLIDPETVPQGFEIRKFY